MSNSSVCSILDLPDEILVKIILHLDPIERLPLEDSCQRFNDLVFGDEELLRNLDFTGVRQLTRPSDIQEYFNNEDTRKKIHAINAENVEAVISLKSSIPQAINLVELNILGVFVFKSVVELSSFLKPMVHLERLSVNWPSPSKRASYANTEGNQVLKEVFSRLTHLSIGMEQFTYKFILILQLCEQLKELHLFLPNDELPYGSPLRQELMKLSNLKFVRIVGSADADLLRRFIMSIVSDPAEWTDFHPSRPGGELYLDYLIVDRRLVDYFPEKNVEVCAKLRQVKEMPPPRNVRYYRETGCSDKDWPLVPVHLLSEVIRVTHEDAPKKFCCLSSSGFPFNQPCGLKIDEIKKLLKDPEYQISYLNFSYSIEKNCDVHLLASAFPDLTELVLSGMGNRNSTTPPEETKPLYRRLSKKGSLASEAEHSNAINTESSFKILVENTPRLKVLEISAKHWDKDAEHWDLDALHLISGWKNLTVIRLRNIPITDGKFLIDIGKECEKLEEVTLLSLRPTRVISYESELLQMLQHCKNLQTLAIQQTIVEHLSGMLDVLSANCSRLQDLRLPIINGECDPLELESSIEEMFRKCQELKRFSIEHYYRGDCNRLRRIVNRITSKLNRPDF